LLLDIDIPRIFSYAVDTGFPKLKSLSMQFKTELVEKKIKYVNVTQISVFIYSNVLINETCYHKNV